MNESNLVAEKISVNLIFKYSPLFFICDQILRISILFAYLYYNFSIWYFLLAQLALLIITGFINDKNQKKIKTTYKKFVNPKYVNLNPDIELSDNIPTKLMGYQMLFGYAFSFWFFYHIFDNHLWYHYILIVFLAILGLIPCLGALLITPIYRTSKGAQEVQVFIRKTIVENGLEKVVPVDATSKYQNFITQGVVIEPDPIDFDTVDLNDTKIAKLESELKSLN